ncbi:MAG: zf-HC2 domain-containing protein [Spirochaetes bacterium]|nr:zf-HC2 domain-containing protein [Spirochaetota bacterium]
MCLDRQLLSAWVDGEVPPPWDDRVREHLESCPSCRAVAESFSHVGVMLNGESVPDAEAAASIRVWERLAPQLANRPRSASPRFRGPAVPRVPGALSVPLPLAAAAAAAFLVLSGFLVSTVRQNQVLRTAVFTSNEIPARSAQTVGMESFMQYLENQNAQLTITVQLPGGANLDALGKPVIMKASGGSE